MRPNDKVTFSSITATTAAFKLSGGAYVIDAQATWGGGSLTLERLGPDGTNYLTAATAITANGVTAGLVLPKGTYRLAVATATAIYASITRVPGE